MGAVYKREMRSYFTSPIGYVVAAVLFALYGFYYYSVMLSGSTYYISTFVYSNMFIWSMMLLPILTMRVFSEEQKNRTDQALLTAPVSLTGIALGKFLAALLLFAIGISITLVFAVIIAFQVTPDWLVIVGNYVGLLLLGGMVIAIGLFISSLTESQFIAALGTFVVSFAMIMVDSLGSVFSSVKWITSVVNFISVSSRYSDFTSGVINYDNVVFFLSLQALFVFLTVRVLDRKRWS